MKRTHLSNAEKNEARKIIEERTGHCIKSTCILNQIFRRSSLAAEIGQSSNEIFEFIGDDALSHYVVKAVAKRCGGINLALGDYTFKIRESNFTQIKQELVNNRSLAKIIDEWDIAKYLLVSESDIKNNVINEEKAKADLFESIIGAIAVESEWDPTILETAISRALDIDAKITEMIENDGKSIFFDMDTAITVLKETAEKGKCTMPVYSIAGPDALGYDKNGNPIWICTCSIIGNTGITKLVIASSKKGAKKAAAYLVLCDYFDAQNKYGPNDWFGTWQYKDGRLIPDRI